jgi:hypothetical protein
MVNIDWNLVLLVLSALGSSCLAIIEIYRGYNEYIENKKRRMLAKKEELKEKLSSYQNSVEVLERSLKEYVVTNKFERGYGAGAWNFSSDLRERIKKYNEIYDRCVDWKKASQAVITLHLQKLSRKYLPKTYKEYDLVSVLNNTNELMQRYLNGEEVTKHWLEKKYPTGLYDTLIENLKDKETKLDLFFLKLNETFQEEPVLNRFRKEKKELIQLGSALLTDLKKEEETLEKALKKI